MAESRRWLIPGLAVLVACGCEADEKLVCGAGTQEVDGECVPIDTSDDDAADDDGADDDGADDDAADDDSAPLEPGHYSSPLIELDRAQGEEDHMHIYEVKYRDSDARLFVCSYDFTVLDASDPMDLAYLTPLYTHQTPSGSPRDPGCLHLAWDETVSDVVYTTHRQNIDFATFLSGWVLETDPEDEDLLVATQLPALQEPEVSYEGVDYENGLIYVAIHEDGMAAYQRDESNPDGFTRVGTASGLANAWDVKVRDTTAFVCDEEMGVVTLDVTDPAAMTILGSLPIDGQPRDLFLDGDLAYVAAGSGGLVILDVSDVSAPVLLSQVSMPGTAETVAVANGRAHVAAWNDTRVFDVADPSNPTMIAGLRNTVDIYYDAPEDDGNERPDGTARTFGVDAWGDVMFVGNWWVPYAYEVHADRQAPYMVLPEEMAQITFASTEVGASTHVVIDVANHGTAPLTVFDSWVDDPAFTVEPRQLRVEPGEEGSLTLTYTATTTEMETGLVTLWSDDPQQPVRQGYLVGNLPGEGVGSPLTETTAILTDGTDWSSADYPGQVMLLAYFATF